MGVCDEVMFGMFCNTLFDKPIPCYFRDLKFCVSLAIILAFKCNTNGLQMLKREKTVI